MRLRAILFVLTALGATGLAAHRLGEAATGYVERTTVEQAAEGLAAAGETWASARADGLIVTLAGAAPDEARRLRAVEILRQIVHPGRVRDATRLAKAAPDAPPPFKLELLRNGDEVSLIGLAPTTAGRDAIAEALVRHELDGAIIDMLESVGQPAPDGWTAALDFGLAALGTLAQAQISVAPGSVSIVALAASEAEGRAIEAALRTELPAGVTLAVAITAPRPVIAPFGLDYALAGGAGRLIVCAAETAHDARAIAAAADLPATDCTLGLGAPAADWSTAAAAGIAAVRDLEGGRFTLVDLEAALAPPEGIAPARLADVTARLEAALPAAFALDVVAQPATAPATQGARTAPPRFDVVLAPDGTLRLTGPVEDAISQAAIGSYAEALFGADRVRNATEIDATVPEGWPGRVLAGVEALALMKEGAVGITPQGVSLDGWAETADGRSKAAALFATRDMGATDIAVRFDAAAARAEAAARAATADPVGTCAAAVADIAARSAIAFRPGSAELEPVADTVIAALAQALAACPPVDFEIAGHTDSQGAAERNQELSEARAATVKAALEAADLPFIGFVARGYGASRPIAENDTETGRAKNRRIAFTLIEENPVATVALIEDAEARFGPQ